MHRVFSIPAVCALVAAALAGCAADNGDEGILILSNSAPPDDSCSFTGSEDQAFLSRGNLSVFATEGYEMHPLMKSKIIATEDKINERTIAVEGARINLTFPDETVFSAAQQDDFRSRGIMRFTQLFAAPLTPNGGTSNGRFDIVTPALLSELIAAKGAAITGPDEFLVQVVATVVVYGDVAGEEVVSQEFQYPVNISNNRIVRVLGTCPLPAGTVVAQGNFCNPYQDGVVDCCSVGTGIRCPATIGP
jgi:hypothetical protein